MEKLKLLIIVISVIQFSCSSTLEKRFNEKTVKDDIEIIREKLDSTDFKLLAGSMIRLKLQNKNIEDMTYSEILEDGKKWKEEQERIQKEQKLLAEKALKEEQERISRLTKSVIVTCFEKGYVQVDYKDYITYKFAIQNKSKKDIRAIKGEVTFTNIFDEKIKSLNFVYDQPIKAGNKVVWSGTSDYNQFKNEDQTLKNKKLKDLKVVWKPEKIIFVDGSTLD